MTRSPDRSKNLFRNGSSFWNCYCDIADSLHQNQDLSLLGPLFVNLAFAGELYLKTTVAAETGVSVEGHPLDTLFNKIPQSTRAEIEGAYEAGLAKSHIRQLLAKARPDLDLRLAAVLKEAAKTFELWRYPGEKAPLNVPGTLQFFVGAVQTYLCTKHPALLSALTSPLRQTGLQIAAVAGMAA